MRGILLVNAMVVVGLLFGQVADEIPYTDNFVPVGTRAVAMGGAHIALAQDYSAAYYNPALLGHIYANEVSGAISIRDGNNIASINNGPDRTEYFSAVKLNDLSLVLSAKAKRGGLAMAFGYYRYQSFDRSAYFFGQRSAGDSIKALETNDGGIGSYYFGIGGQVSKYVSVGATIEALVGAENYTWDATIWGFEDSLVADSVFSDDITNDISGVTGRFGVAVMPNKYFSWGLLVKFPSYIKIKQEYLAKTYVEKKDGYTDVIEDYQYDEDIELLLPFQFGTGVAFKSPYVNLAADVLYSDWRGTRYYGPAYLVDENPYIPDSYRAVLSVGGGLEFTVPIKFLPTRIRFGYRFEPLAYKPYEYDKTRQMFTGGLAFLADKNFLIEISGFQMNWDRRYTTSSGNAVGENYDIFEIHLGVAYRFR